MIPRNNELEPGALATDTITVRTLRMEDLAAVVKIDEAATQIARPDFYRQRIRRSLEESSIHLSLAAEIDGVVVGFVTVTFYQGEFGIPDPSAVLDAVGVHPDHRGHHVAAAMLRQLEMNLRALHVETLRTEVDWDQGELMAFMRRSGFRPAPRLCLEKKLSGR